MILLTIIGMVGYFFIGALINKLCCIKAQKNGDLGMLIAFIFFWPLFALLVLCSAPLKRFVDWATRP